MDQANKLKTLLEDTKYSIFQANGQRIYGLRNNDANKFPPKGTELFVGKLPRTIYEDELVPLFSQTAPIYQLRLMVDFAGRNRGYCFVRYFTREAADMALRKLHNYQIREGCQIGVFKSLDNTRLFVGGIPQNITIYELKEALEQHMDGIKDVIMYPMAFDPTRNRGYAFIEFENHRAAAIARRCIPPRSLMLWGLRIKIDWAEPLPEPDPEIMSKVTALYFRNFPSQLSYTELKDSIEAVVEPNSIYKISKCSDYGFVHFRNRHEAEGGIRALRNLMIYDHRLEVTWARPKMYSKKVMQNIIPSHYCLSLPAKQRWIVKQKCKDPRLGESSDYDDAASSDGRTSLEESTQRVDRYIAKYLEEDEPSTSKELF